MTKLKPCPFCGSNNVKINIPYFADALYLVQCYSCNCTTALYPTKNKAVEIWNRRAENG